MTYESERSDFIPVELPNKKIVKVEVTRTGREDVAFDILPFEQVTSALEGIVEAIAETLDKVKPDKAAVKFGVEVAFESGGLTAMIVKGSGKGNLEITLEWGK